MKIATFNINGIRARSEALAGWLDAAAPDVVLLQEIKSQDAEFPRKMFEDRGYFIETHGQKGFNGVAILSRLPLEDVVRGLPGDEGDDQARWIEATVTGGATVRLCALYLPNGNPAPGPKYDYKLAWMERLEERARALLEAEETAVILGDYNVIPEPQDCHDPAAWAEDALFLPTTRTAWRPVRTRPRADIRRRPPAEAAAGVLRGKAIAAHFPRQARQGRRGALRARRLRYTQQSGWRKATG